MTDPTTTTPDATFDTSTAAGRLRILWGATADPQLAMSDDEVADVETVLNEHAAMTAEIAGIRAYLADPFNRLRIAEAVKRAHRQRDETVEAAEAELEEYKADLVATNAELAELRAQMAAEPAPFRFGKISDKELAAAEEAFTAAWAESKGKPLQIYQPAHTFVSQWSVRYLEDGIVSDKYHTEAEARQRAKANPRTMELVTRLVESEWRGVGDADA